jgi:hypothetical protein
VAEGWLAPATVQSSSSFISGWYVDCPYKSEEEFTMLWTLIVLLLLFWVLGFAFNVAGGIIHMLLVIALVLFLVNLISGRRTVV